MVYSKKQTMKHFLSLFAIILVFTACNKNQNAVKKLDGNWKATRYEVRSNGKTSDYLEIGLSFNYYFDNCKLKQNQYCQLTIDMTNDFTTTTDIKLYRVTNYGKALEFIDPLDNNNITRYTIQKLSSQTVKLKKTENNAITFIELKKV